VPAYDFVCRQCGQAFEMVINSYLPEREKQCPQCRSRDVRQTWRSLFRDGPAPTPGCAPAGSGFG
jgi:putative FmdB family regulatory protein